MLLRRKPRLTGADHPVSAGRPPLALMVALVLGVPLAIVALAAVVLAAMAFSGTSIDASRWRDAAAQRASAALGRPVVLQGPLKLELRPSREVGLRVGALRVLNAPGAATPELLAVDELHARVDIIAALRGQFQSSSIQARAVDLWLERGAEDATAPITSPQSRSSPLHLPIEIAAITVERVTIHDHDARSATRRALQLERASGSLGWDRPLRLAAHGVLEPGVAYVLGVEGGALRLLEAGAWPLTVAVDAPSTRLRATGAVNARERSARLQLDLQAEDLAPLASLAALTSLSPLLGPTLMELRSASAQALLDIGPKAVEVTGLQGRLGESDFAGEVLLSYGGARPRLRGGLRMGTLDLRPFMAAQPAPASPASTPDLPLRALAAIDAEVDISVERWLGLGVEVREARLAWRADERGVRAPLSLTLAGVPLAGGLDVDVAAPIPSMTFQLGADKVALGALSEALGGASSVRGTVDRVRLRIAGRGATTAALVDDLGLSLAVSGARLRLDDASQAEPIAVAIDTLDLAAGGGRRLTGRAQGSVRQQPATLRLRGGTLAQLLDERVLPLELELALAQSRAQLNGTLALPGGAYDTDMRFAVRAPRSGDLAPWLNVAPESNLPVVAQGRLVLSANAWAIEQTALELGHSRLTVDARSTSVAGRPGVAASVRGTFIDTTELSTLRPTSEKGAARGSSATADIAAPSMKDVDLDVKLQRLRLRGTDLHDVAFVANMRDGRMAAAPLTGRIAATPFEARLDLDLRAQPVAAGLALSSGALDIGALLRGLGVAEVIDGQVQSLQVNLRGRGNTPGDWIDRAAVDIRVKGGALAVRGAARSTITEVRIDEGRLGAQAGEPVRLLLDGALAETPVQIEVTTGTLEQLAEQLAKQSGRVPFRLAALAADTQLTLDGEVSLPLGGDAMLTLQMRGERLDALSALARVELPPWGPWSFTSPVHRTASGYALPALTASVGQSRFTGAATLDLRGPRPNLDLRIVAPSIQLDDFPPPKRLAGEEAPPKRDRNVRQAAVSVVRRTDTLLSAAVLRRVDASVDIKAAEVLSGTDRLADGSIRVTLKNGHLEIAPAVVNLPAGALRLAMSYDLKGSEVELGVALQIENFDYGLVARRIGFAEDISGLLSVNMAFFGRAPSLDQIMLDANGRFDFAVWPKELNSGAFSLWTVNLVLQLLPLVDPDGRRVVNCIVGRFDLDHGTLRDDNIVIDTSAVRIRGTGEIDLKSEELAFSFRPRAKGLALFRLQTPLRVTGKLGDQRFGFNQIEFATSVLRMVASPVLQPIERMRLGPLPRDGADVCTNPLRAVAQ